MRSLWRAIVRPVYIPFISKLEEAYKAFSPSGRALFIFFAGMLVISSSALLFMLNNSLLVAVPGRGGTLTEGIVGSPRFINPVLAISDSDRDLTALTYSGLLRATPEGSYAPDLAESYQISADGKTYSFTLRSDATFHDGTPVTADDIAFTVARIQDPAIKSPLRANWEGVAVEQEGPRIIRFTLKGAYAPFIENATLGILPKHLWDGVSAEEFPFSELNIEPIGSGPFRVNSIARTPSGIPSSYELRGFKNYTLGAPFLSTLTFRFYQNEQALINAVNGGEVEAASGLTPASLSQLQDQNVRRASLNRVFGVFFNQNQSEVLLDVDVRTALESSIDRQALVHEVLHGYGTPLEDPVPPTIVPMATSSATTTQLSTDERVQAAKDYLLRKGWKANEQGILTKTTGTGTNAKTKTLAFSLSTGNVPELRAAAEYLRATWATLGADVEVKIFDQGDLTQNVIRPRNYDALLFGEVIGRELDLYAFWHSSQRNDPGLNIALYTNVNVDQVLEDLRVTANEEERTALYRTFRTELKRDIPAVFLYSPDFVYSIPNSIQGLDLGFVETPSDRFLSVSEWHRETDYVWPVFAR